MVEEQDNNEAEFEEEMTADEFASASSNPKMVTVTDEELKNLQKEIMEYKDKYLRVLAESENARKRLQKEKQEMTRYAVENAIVEFLHPLDNLENALKMAQNMSDDVKNWAYGFQMILTQFKDVLAGQGVVSVDSKGTHFDPHKHEAVEMIETDDQEPGTIIEECVRGYKMGDRTIRPARVKVVKATENKESQNKPQNEKNNNDKGV
jgi:molecular chaperone GrpE